jgi:hypothetical protein
MQSNYGMIHNQENSIPRTAVEITQEWEKIDLLARWVQCITGSQKLQHQFVEHYSAERSPLEVRLYALFAD